MSFLGNLWRDLVRRLKSNLREQRRYKAGFYEGLRMDLDSCPVCGEAVESHELARVSAVKKTDRVSIRQLLKERKWSELAKLDTWDPTEDNLLLYLLRCPNRQEFVPFEVHDPFEPYYKSRISEIHESVGHRVPALEEALQGRWKTFEAAAKEGP